MCVGIYNGRRAEMVTEFWVGQVEVDFKQTQTIT